MKRLPMFFEATTVYYGYKYANGSHNLFGKKKNYHYCLQHYSSYTCHVVVTCAYWPLPNHLHLVVRIQTEGEALKCVKKKQQKLTLQGFQNLGGLIH